MAEKWDISREAMEEFALRSHQRAVAAPAEGRFGRAIVRLGSHRGRGTPGPAPGHAEAGRRGQPDQGGGVVPDLRRCRGAIALGDPLSATGARLMTTLLERTGGRDGLHTMCEGVGQANVTIIERL